MAKFSIDYTSDSVQIIVSGLKGTNKIRFYIRLDTSSSSGTVVDTEISYNLNICIKTFDGLKPNTSYAVNVNVTTSDGTSTWLGTKYFTTNSDSAMRPDDWYWWSTIYRGRSINISAREWNTFCDRINEFREYCGFGYYDFTTVYRGDEISAHIVNQARTAISHMTSKNLPYRVYSGDTFTADFFNKLRDALNSIP